MEKVVSSTGLQKHCIEVNGKKAYYIKALLKILSLNIQGNF